MLMIQTPQLSPPLLHQKCGRRQARAGGFSLVELMVGLVVGAIVIAAVTSIYVLVTQSSAYATQEARLTQETRITMDFIASDIRRAGYSHPERIIEHDDEERLPTNWFMEEARWLNIHDFGDGTGNCILVSYDPTFLYPIDEDGWNDPDSDNFGDTHPEPPAQYVFGYRENNGTVEMLTGGLSDTQDCGSGNWEALTDPDTTWVTELSFDASESGCMRVSADGGTDEPEYGSVPCDGFDDVSDGDIFAESARVMVTLRAEHANDDATQVRHSDTVSVRNQRIFDHHD